MANLLLTLLPFALTFTIAAWKPKFRDANQMPVRQDNCPGNAMYC